MPILTSSEPLVLNPNRVAKTEMLAELQRLSSLDLSDQAAAGRQIIVIAGLPTHWSNPISENLPAFVASAFGKQRRLFLKAPDDLNYAVYDGAGDIWTRRTLTRRGEFILAALPKRAMTAANPTAEATPKQLAALRKFLDFAPDAELPRLHTISVSRLIERILIERYLPPILDDLHAWVEARIDEDKF